MHRNAGAHAESALDSSIRGYSMKVGKVAALYSHQHAHTARNQLNNNPREGPPSREEGVLFFTTFFFEKKIE